MNSAKWSLAGDERAECLFLLLSLLLCQGAAMSALLCDYLQPLYFNKLQEHYFPFRPVGTHGSLLLLVLEGIGTPGWFPEPCLQLCE